LAATVNFVRHEGRLGRAGAGALIDLAIVAPAISFAFVAHLIEIALWAVLLVICGEFQELGNAYHSAVNYTTLGYGDLLLTPSWRLLGPLEAANRALMFGVSTAMIFECSQCRAVGRHGMVGEEASDHLLEPGPLLGDRFVHAPLQFLLAPPERCPHAIPPCCSFDKQLPTAVALILPMTVKSVTLNQRLVLWKPRPPIRALSRPLTAFRRSQMSVRMLAYSCFLAITIAFGRLQDCLPERNFDTVFGAY
jgi:hypothetical protein